MNSRFAIWNPLSDSFTNSDGGTKLGGGLDLFFVSTGGSKSASVTFVTPFTYQYLTTEATESVQFNSVLNLQTSRQLRLVPTENLVRLSRNSWTYTSQISLSSPIPLNGGHNI